MRTLKWLIDIFSLWLITELFCISIIFLITLIIILALQEIEFAFGFEHGVCCTGCGDIFIYKTIISTETWLPEPTSPALLFAFSDIRICNIWHVYEKCDLENYHPTAALSVHANKVTNKVRPARTRRKQACARAGVGMRTHFPLARACTASVEHGISSGCTICTIAINAKMNCAIA